MTNKFKFLSLILLFSCLFLLSAAESKKELPDGYRDIHLGMSLDETKENLLKDSNFGYNGDADVSLVPGDNTTLIETDAERFGSIFLQRCWFQFHQDYLYTITININPAKMDYYSIFTTLKEKYGEPVSINPQRAVWKNEDITMSLEKPLTLKYLDNKIFDQLQNYSAIEKSSTEVTRQMFLDDL